jgi:orotate phosphoribosyltransferase
MQTSLQIADYLLTIQAVKLNVNAPFTWSSGWKSPIYCDNRVILSYANIRTYVKNAFIELIQTHFPEANGIAGVATAGIAHGALIADAMNTTYVYVRSSPKSHGMKNLIEGRIVEGAKYVVVEDLISTGGSSLKVIDALREAGADVVGTVAIFTYGFPEAAAAFAEKGVPLATLSDLPALLESATALEYLTNDAWETIQEWQKSPSTWRQ